MEYGQLEQRLRSPGADRSRMEQVRVQTLARVREMFNAVVADATVIKCPRDWQDFNNTCYRFSTESGGWHNANRSCVLNNATLAILSSLGQQEYVMNYDREKRWIGLTDLEELGVYRWVNGDRLVTGYWALGEPNNAGVERCVTKGARFHPNKWNNDVCTTQHRWICQITRFDYAARHFGLEALLNQ
ncbi:C-type lectin domain family 4 member M-like [Scyliorhinus canicula]|uniref:C-type lectin domain family 4 member M-like n=1 Tax=Scyliorhinus canicula TaxID=7830 RepID=UPI0018F4F299|nr:C-type lectin domain family 4 member M-like [Scyliorhinus canicula]